MQNTTAYVQAITGSKATLLAVGTQFLNYAKHTGYCEELGQLSRCSDEYGLDGPGSISDRGK
jgi:hypothetical protein